MDIVLVNTAREEALAAMAGAGGPLDTLTLFVFTNAITPNANTVIGDLTPATFTGATPVAGIVFGDPWIDVDGRWKISAPDHLFQRTGGVVSETVYGWGVATAALAALVGCALLDAPVALDAVGKGVLVTPIVPADAISN